MNVRRRWLVGGLSFGVALLAAGAGVLPASAATSPASSSSVVIRRVDGSKPSKTVIDVAVNGANPGLRPAFTVDEKGHTVDAAVTPLASTNTPRATVYVVDTSASMNNGAKLDAVRAALVSLVQAKSPAELVAIVAYGHSSRIVQGLTTDPAVLIGAINSMTLGGDPVLYDGVEAASSMLVPLTQDVTQVVVIGDAADVGSTASFSDARGSLEADHAYTYGIGLQYGTPKPADLSSIQSFASLGGQYFEAADAAAVPGVFSSLRQQLAQQYQISYSSTASLPANVTVSLGGAKAVAQVTSGVAVGTAVNPPQVKAPQAPGPLKGKTGLLLIGVLVLAGGAMLLYAVITLALREDTSLRGALRPYADAASRAASDEEASDQSLVQTAILQRAMETTTRIAEERGIMEIVETKLDQANLALRPAEAFFFYVVGVVLVLVLGVLLLTPVMGLILAMVAALLPPAALNFMAKQRLRKFNSLLPDTLQLLASSLRAGFSFMQGVEAVSQEVEEPMGGELRRVIIEARLGRPVEEALQDCAGRMKSPDFDWAVMAVNIQREVGGNLADLLQTVGATMIERERLRREVRALTAEGRMSAIVLGILPPGVGVMFYTLNPDYMKPLFSHTGGQIALGVAAVGMVFGFFWMNKIVNIDV